MIIITISKIKQKYKIRALQYEESILVYSLIKKEARKSKTNA